MENLKKEEVSVFEGFNYRHQQLLEKLSELESRLHSSITLLGGEYPLKESKELDTTLKSNHLDNYSTQLNYMEHLLVHMFDHIEVLEHLVCK